LKKIVKAINQRMEFWRGKTKKTAENTPSAETKAVESANISEIDVTIRAIR